jgi:hypothetical protein
MIHININIEHNKITSDPFQVHSYLAILFITSTGIGDYTCIGTLVRPIHPHYTVNSGNSCFLRFIDEVNKDSPCPWMFMVNSEESYRLDYTSRANSGGRINLIIRDHASPQLVNIGTPDVMRNVWCWLIREGFRPTMAPFILE